MKSKSKSIKSKQIQGFLIESFSPSRNIIKTPQKDINDYQIGSNYQFRRSQYKDRQSTNKTTKKQSFKSQYSSNETNPRKIQSNEQMCSDEYLLMANQKYEKSMKKLKKEVKKLKKCVQVCEINNKKSHFEYELLRDEISSLKMQKIVNGGSAHNSQRKIVKEQSFTGARSQKEIRQLKQQINLYDLLGIQTSNRITQVSIPISEKQKESSKSLQSIKKKSQKSIKPKNISIQIDSPQCFEPIIDKIKESNIQEKQKQMNEQTSQLFLQPNKKAQLSYLSQSQSNLLESKPIIPVSRFSKNMVSIDANDVLAQHKHLKIPQKQEKASSQQIQIEQDQIRELERQFDKLIRLQLKSQNEQQKNKIINKIKQIVVPIVKIHQKQYRMNKRNRI